MSIIDNPNVHVTHLTDQPTAAADELVRVPAGDVVIENNVRTAADLDAAFLASVKQHGVLLPTIGYRDAEGHVVVRDGQMRVLAARETGHDVPVFVTARETTEAQRLVEQLVANERRSALTEGDRLQAYRQLELAGLSVTAIAKQTGTKRAQVKDTLTVAKSEVATAAVVERQLSFDDALIFAEFDGDQDAIDALNGYIEQGWGDNLAVYAERIRQDRARAAAAAALVVEYEANGVRVIDREQDAHAALWSLTDTEPEADTERSEIVAENHQECPGRAVYIQATYGDPRVVEVCTTPEAHHPLYTTPAAPEVTEVSEADEDAAREAKRQARRTLIENNKQWDAAEAVRRAWLADTLLSRKTAPKDAARFLALALTRHATTRYASGTVSARGLLGIEASGWDGDTLSQWVEEHPTKGLHMALAVVIAGFENTANREWWRTPDRESRGYLTQLAAWGYPLSRVEQIAAGIQPDTDDADSSAEPDDAAEDATVRPITSDADDAPDAA